MTEVRLQGEGGVVWTFELPLHDTMADQVKTGKLLPADDLSVEALEAAGYSARQEPETEDGEADETAPEPTWPTTHAELDALADGFKLTWPDPPEGKVRLTVAQKVEALEAAGYSAGQEPTEDDEAGS